MFLALYKYYTARKVWKCEYRNSSIGGLPKFENDEIDIRHLHVFVRGLPKFQNDENREITCQNARERFPATRHERIPSRVALFCDPKCVDENHQIRRVPWGPYESESFLDR